jgi:hypothetical protein
MATRKKASSGSKRARAPSGNVARRRLVTRIASRSSIPSGLMKRAAIFLWTGMVIRAPIDVAPGPSGTSGMDTRGGSADIPSIIRAHGSARTDLKPNAAG